MIPPTTNRGHITCILGPMFSGKTTELLRLHDRQVLSRKKCVLVKYAGDNRYNKDLIATHNKVTGDGLTVKAYRLADVREEIFDPSIQVISIDEGQFYDDMADTVEELARCGKTVYVAALNGTFARKPFEQVSKLLPMAEEVRQLYSVCMECGEDAVYTFRNSTDKTVEVIGGTDKYRALCRTCYYTESIKRDGEENAPPAPAGREKTTITAQKRTMVDSEDCALLPKRICQPSH